jgi:hypothetical protein
VPARRLHLAEKVFVVFCVALTAVALAAFWPPANAAIISWLVLWCGLCLLTAGAIMWRLRLAPVAVWGLVGLTILSAMAAIRDGMLDATGILIDVVLFVPLIWFSVWYHGRRRNPG